mmetsp:Transcript_39131/g.45499  ORF Transcript_39131/g.45499 Transcript_39131/m.45499 type:complete len:419 (+) Transcript_39131:25-1281(+)|eukprot:CAMPEP_0176434762 /NCGR_PEP_ID=MMETSP0127-20121128/16880_1 /TAXON_ID=938130 /ORGANISM="Platyophrya macrostoma, Strain WH" /LENGTH=418 /DNA_ID=CAMNT_0017817581 /DNA_START=23 /DNA_END=1279 /DNA_ORIENTATION=-
MEGKDSDQSKKLDLEVDNVRYRVIEDPSSSPLKKNDPTQASKTKKSGTKSSIAESNKETTGGEEQEEVQKQKNDIISQPLENIKKPISVSKKNTEGSAFQIEEYRKLGKGEEELLVCRFDNEDLLLACGTMNGSVQIYQISTGKFLRSFECAVNSSSPASCLRWRPLIPGVKEKSVLLTANADGVITHWNIHDAKMMSQFKETENQVLALDFNKDGSLFATAGKDQKIRIYCEETHKVTTELHRGFSGYPGHSNRIFSLKFVEEDPNLLISGGWDRSVHIWDLRTAKSTGSIFGPAISGDSIDCKNDTILTGSWRNFDQLQIWDMKSRKLIKNVDWEYGFKTESAYVYSAQFSKSGTQFIIAGTSTRNEVRVFDEAADYQPCGKVKFEKSIYSVDFAHTRKMFAFCGGDGEAYIYKII